MRFRPVILAGGAGTRLWPLSRQRQPKPFLPLIGGDCLFTTTLRSLQDPALFLPPIIVGNRDYKFIILEKLEQLGIRDAWLILEPEGRNTAPAALMAALADEEIGKDGFHLVRPSDHLITDIATFHNALADAAPVAAKDRLVLFGIEPAYPETGYGYILSDGCVTNNVRKISSFREKPDEVTARRLIAQGALWNSGIFLYTRRTLLEEAELLAPELLAQCRKAVAQAKRSGDNFVLDAASCAAMENISFDRALMEKTARGAVVPCAMGWSDVGTWQALWRVGEKDPDNNILTGAVVSRDVSESLIYSDGPMVAVMGAKDLMVIATKDSVLVAPRAYAQNVRELAAEAAQNLPALALESPRALRPWGSYENIAEGQGFRVKHITVRPGQSLSLQMHHHRAEHWIVVAGTAQVECDGETRLVFPNESVFVPRGAVHRLGNPGKIDLQLIEVQSGDYIDEGDIVRFDDIYERAS